MTPWLMQELMFYCQDCHFCLKKEGAAKRFFSKARPEGQCSRCWGLPLSQASWMEPMMRMRSGIFLNCRHYNSHSVSTLKSLSRSLFTLTILILINVVVITMVNIPPSLQGLLCPNWCLPSRILPHWKLSQLRTMFQADQCSRSSKHDLKKKGMRLYNQSQLI